MRYLLFLALLVSTVAAAGTIHKWTDENGNVYYGDAPPVSVKTNKVKVTGAPADPGKALPRLGDPVPANTEGADDNTAAAGKVPQDQAAIACKQARDDLKVISSSARIRLRATDGTTKYLSTEEIQNRKLKSEKDIQRFCN